MNKNKAKNIFAPILTVLLFAAFITACDDLESSKDKPNTVAYTIGTLKDAANQAFPASSIDLSVSGTTAKLIVVVPQDSGQDVREETTLPIENGVAKKVKPPLGILINFTDEPVYYRMQIQHDGMGTGFEHYTFDIVVNKDQAALSDAMYGTEYTSMQTLGKNKIVILSPKRDEMSGVPDRDASNRPTMDVYTGTIAKK